MCVTVELSRDSIQSNDTFKRIGIQLRAARKANDLRLVDVAQELRISNDYLRLLEAGDFEALPAPAYVSGFLRSYGGFVGLDGAMLASRYYLILGDASKSRGYKLPMTARAPQRSAPAVASVCVVLAIVAYGSWYSFSGSKTQDSAIETKLAKGDIEGENPRAMEKYAINKEFDAVDLATNSANGMVDEAQPLTDIADALIADGEQAVTGHNTANLVVNSKNQSINKPEPLAGSVGVDNHAVNDTEEISTSNLVKPPAFEASLDDAPVSKMPINELNEKLQLGRTAAIAGLRDPHLEITIRATASSWVEIVRNDGTSVLTKLMKAGETYVVDDGASLYLSTGNAGGIELVTHDNDVIEIGAVGEIVRDLPLAQHRLQNQFRQ
jgi:cytoskeleton protein RodZ